MHQDRSDRLSRFNTANFGRAVVFAAALLASALAAADELSVQSVLGIGPAGRSGRGPVFTDAIEMQLVNGTWRRPVAGEQLVLPDGTARTWTRIDANENGVIPGRDFRGGYALATVTLDEGGVYLLQAQGHRHLYVNDTPRGGDVYNLGFLHLPIELRAGTNELLFKSGRGNLRITLTAPPASAFIEARDRIQPDLLRGKGGTMAFGIPITNASQKPLRGASLHRKGHP